MQPLALVTGAGAGIGRASAIALAARGFIVVASDIAAPALEALAAEIGCIAASCDIASPDAVARLFERIEAEHGGLDALVHSAGLFPKLSFAQATLRDLDAVMNVNFRAAFLLTKAAHPLLARSGGGAIVHLTSGAGLLAALDDPMQADFSLYGASKAALDRWALGIAAELARDGIALNTLTPGAFVLTPGVVALGLHETRARPSISAEAVGEAIAWLAQRPAGGPVGKRLRALEFQKEWGPRAA